MIGSLTYLWSVSQLSLNTIKIHNLIFSVLKVKWSESESRSVVSDSLWPHGLYSPCDSSGQNTGVGSLSLLQGIFPTQGSNPGLLLCRRILYQLSHTESRRHFTVTSLILKWIQKALRAVDSKDGEIDCLSEISD